MTKFYLTCNWDSNQSITTHWEKKLDKVKYPDIEFTCDRSEADYYLVFNKPFYTEGDFDFMNDKTILIRMEPFMEENVNMWGDWAKPDYTKFKSVVSPPECLNFVEWHLDKTFDELKDTIYDEKTKGDTVSVILSDKYQDEGQMKRIDFIRYLQENYSDKIKLDVYGKGNLSRWGIKNHLGELPLYKKDDGILPYKYHFNCENSYKLNYITEKFYDAILGNTFLFYSGAFNANSIYPNGGFVFLDLDDFKTSAELMAKTIKNNKYDTEKTKIQRLKLDILNKCLISKRLHDIVYSDTNQVVIYTFQELLDNFQEISDTRHVIPEQEVNVEPVEQDVEPVETVKQEVNVDDDIKVLLIRVVNSIDRLTDALNRQNLLR